MNPSPPLFTFIEKSFLKSVWWGHTPAILWSCLRCRGALSPVKKSGKRCGLHISVSLLPLLKPLQRLSLPLSRPPNPSTSENPVFMGHYGCQKHLISWQSPIAPSLPLLPFYFTQFHRLFLKNMALLSPRLPRPFPALRSISSSSSPWISTTASSLPFRPPSSPTGFSPTTAEVILSELKFGLCRRLTISPEKVPSHLASLLSSGASSSACTFPSTWKPPHTRPLWSPRCPVISAL